MPNRKELIFSRAYVQNLSFSLAIINNKQFVHWYILISSFLLIFPIEFRGNSLTILMLLGTQCKGNLNRSHRAKSRLSNVLSSLFLVTINAETCWPKCGSSIPITATSSIHGWEIICFSISRALILKSPVLIRSIADRPIIL